MKKIMIGLLALLCSTVAEAQFAIGKSVGQQYVESAIEDGFFLSMHNYRVRNKETGKVYGYDGKPYFGLGYAIGVKVNGGIVLPEKALKPWEYDSDFADYAAEYDALSYEWLYSPIGEKVAYDSLDCSPSDCSQVGGTRVYMAQSKLFDGQGFEIDPTEGFKEGWIVWFTIDSGKDLAESANITVRALRKDITVDPSTPYVNVDKLSTDQTIIGGVYVVPAYPRIGTVELRLCGVLVESDDAWRICCPFVGWKTDAPAADGADRVVVPEPESGQGKGDLTPIEDKADDKIDGKQRTKGKK